MLHSALAGAGDARLAWAALVAYCYANLRYAAQGTWEGALGLVLRSVKLSLGPAASDCVAGFVRERLRGRASAYAEARHGGGAAVEPVCFPCYVVAPPAGRPLGGAAVAETAWHAAWLWLRSGGRARVALAREVSREPLGVALQCPAAFGGLALLRELADAAREEQRGAPGVIRVGHSRTVAVRPLGTVVLPRKVRQALEREVGGFCSEETRALYRRMGRPYRLGVLLHGPPGTGKSSAAPALCRMFGATRVHVFSGCRALLRGCSCVEPGSAVLVEDVDRDFASPEGGLEHLPELLNFLDGPASVDNTLVVMTANDADALPAVLLRPGRIDVRVEIGYASHAQVEQYARLFFGDQAPGAAAAAAEVARLVSSTAKAVTLAQVQALLFRHRRADAVLAALRRRAARPAPGPLGEEDD